MFCPSILSNNPTTPSLFFFLIILMFCPSILSNQPNVPSLYFFLIILMFCPSISLNYPNVLSLYFSLIILMFCPCVLLKAMESPGELPQLCQFALPSPDSFILLLSLYLYVPASITHHYLFVQPFILALILSLQASERSFMISFLLFIAIFLNYILFCSVNLKIRRSLYSRIFDISAFKCFKYFISYSTCKYSTVFCSLQKIEKTALPTLLVWAWSLSNIKIHLGQT